MNKAENETSRLLKMSVYENRCASLGFYRIAGIDEAGRGPLAGPVVAAAVILPPGCLITGVNDSKKLSPKQRDILFEKIISSAIAISTGIVGEKEIDSINILNATKKAMAEAVRKLDPKPDYLLIDAVRLENVPVIQENIIKGDSLSISIAAASIIAKVTRDRIMDEYEEEFPQYGFSRHKGYGTPEHIKALAEYGLCPIHRISFTGNFISKR